MSVIRGAPAAKRAAFLAPRVGRHLDVVRPVHLRATAYVLLLLASSPACGGGGGDDDAPGDTPDAAAGDTPDAGGDPETAIAVPGMSCAPAERVGLIQVTSSYLYTDLRDRTDPFIGEPALTDDHCAFHEYAPSDPCPICGDDEVCSIEGDCVDAPRRDTDATLVLRAGDDEQTFDADDLTGDLYGEISLAGPSYTVDLDFFGQRVTLEAPLAAPELLPGFSAMLVGTYDAPEAVEASWDAVPAGTTLFTRVPINHHAGGATFTECAISGAESELTIPGEMLEPLAVSTGLEFQGFDHLRVAAADTDRGCVEIRFITQQSSGLEGI